MSIPTPWRAALAEYADGKWDRLVYLPCNAENGFVPALPVSLWM